jgi:addiction module HigA family antidote
MPSLNIDSPGKTLQEKYLKPKDIAARRFSSLSGIAPSAVNEVLKGAPMSHNVIHRVSMVTRTATRFWYYLQARWEFQKYLTSRKDIPEIEPIRFEIQSHSFEAPGKVLQRDFVKPSGKSYHALAKILHIHWMTLPEIINGKRRITPLMAHKLAKAFDTETRYWLDLQTCYEIRQLLQKNPVSEKQISKSLSRFSKLIAPRRRRFQSKDHLVYPGKILKERFIKRSKMGIIDWHKILCIPSREFKAILGGRSVILSQHLLKLSRVFNPDIGYWIEMINGFYAHKADSKFSKALKQIGRVGDEVTFQNSSKRNPPLKWIFDNFLKPMQITQSQFFKYIKLNKANYNSVDFELAIRLGQALDMDPLYWVTLQLEFDIENFEKGKGAQTFHLR